MKRIGIYSGTFDPVHNGHIGFAMSALNEAGLDEVVFIPERTPREKDHVTSLEHRFELITRAIAPYDGLSVRLLSADRFCVRGTMPELQQIFEGAELSMLMGSDVVKTFPQRWANLDDLFTDMNLVIGVRRGDDRKSLKKLLKHLDVHVKPRYTFVNSPLAGASSTRVRHGQSVRDAPPEVSTYIEAHELYRKK